MCNALAHPAQLMCWKANRPAPSPNPATIPNHTAVKRNVPGELRSNFRVGIGSAMNELFRPELMGAAQGFIVIEFSS